MRGGAKPQKGEGEQKTLGGEAVSGQHVKKIIVREKPFFHQKSYLIRLFQVLAAPVAPPEKTAKGAKQTQRPLSNRIRQFHPP
ncbi:MAG: hypothetical protein LBE14_07765, partial [Treponema sp.]|nr:hypothetical protein [Treponema sp.]